jgi:hypothetical protein
VSERLVYVVMLPLPGSGDWWDVCRCDSPLSVAAVLRALLSSGDSPPPEIRVQTRKEVASA